MTELELAAAVQETVLDFQSETPDPINLLETLEGRFKSTFLIARWAALVIEALASEGYDLGRSAFTSWLDALDRRTARCVSDNTYNTTELTSLAGLIESTRFLQADLAAAG